MEKKKNHEGLITEWIKSLDLVIVDAILEKATLRKIKKGTVVQKAGEPGTEMYYLLEGAFRGFRINEEGKENTISIDYRKGDILFSSVDLKPMSKSLVNIQAIRDSKVLVIPLDYIYTLEHRYPEIKDFYLQVLNKALLTVIEKANIQSMSAYEKCAYFHNKNSFAEKKIQRQYIAAFLGMTLSTYGKIMKK